MQVSNLIYEQVNPDNGNKFIIQNVGDTRIAYVFSDSTDPPDDSWDEEVEGGPFPMEDGSHGVLMQCSPPFTIVDMNTDGKYLYVKSLGPKPGLLYVA